MVSVFWQLIPEGKRMFRRRNERKRTSGKALAVILALAMVFGLMPAMSMSVMANEISTLGDEYMKPVITDEGVTFSLARSDRSLYVSSDTTTWSEDTCEWYVVSSYGGVITITSKITVQGDVNLILGDGHTLEAKGGIYVPKGSSLTIYGQDGGTGKLIAGGASKNAGIGGSGLNDSTNVVEESGAITINGGVITAVGGVYGAGIGGGDCQESGQITINGGVITATGGEAAAGIGGSGQGGPGHVTINGGTITAVGGRCGSGIGNGSYGVGGDVTINGGTITATAGADTGAGIGTTLTGGKMSVTINRGLVTAAGTSTSGAGINGGNGGSVTINGGDVTAKADHNGSQGAGIGAENGKVQIYGGKVSASANTRDAITGELILGDLIGVYANANSSGKPYQIGGSVSDRYGAMSTKTSIVDYQYPKVKNGKVTFSKKTITDFVSVDPDVKEWSDGWYVVDMDEALEGGVTVTGTVNLILCDRFKLDISGPIWVNEGNTLNIFCQSGGSGTLNVTAPEFNQPGIGGSGSAGTITINGGIINATGMTYGAGIGGGYNSDGGTITINGGTVTAVSGYGCAAIGSGYNAPDDQPSEIGTITINGGTVTARAGYGGGAGIGGGRYSIGGTITINGGIVDARGEHGAGIGGGMNGKCELITINGGDVTGYNQTDGTGTAMGSGIGSGASGSFGELTINGGTVTGYANKNTSSGSNSDGAGIGGGRYGRMGTITINNGTVTGISNDTGAGIGGGYSSEGGTITVNGGTVTGGCTGKGAGIGSGQYGGAGTIEINGGSVIAYADNETGDVQAIGMGVEGTGSGTLILKEGVAVYDNQSASGTPYQIGGTVTDRYPYMSTAVLYVVDSYGNKFYKKSGQPEAVNTVLKNKKISYQVIKDSKSDPQVTVKGLVNKSLTSVGIPATVTFHGVTYKVTKIKASAFKAKTKITKVSIGANVTSIGHYAFKGCTALASVTGCTGVKIIGKQAFYGCTSLAGAAIGSKVTTINDLAFYKCTALAKITIPATTKTIGKKAFMGCKNLKTVVIKTTKLTTGTVGAYAFKSINSKAVVKVPKAKLSAYKTLLKKRGITGANQTIKGF